MDDQRFGFLAICPQGHEVNATYTLAERAQLAQQESPAQVFCLRCGTNWTPPPNEQANMRKWARGEA